VCTTSFMCFSPVWRHSEDGQPNRQVVSRAGPIADS
jgi:hypothetical protein